MHISEVTAKFLSREFELEPGDGDQREDGIRAAGIKTFLVKSVLKPVWDEFVMAKPQEFPHHKL